MVYLNTYLSNYIFIPLISSEKLLLSNKIKYIYSVFQKDNKQESELN